MHRPQIMQEAFDSVFVGDVVTSTEIIRDGYVAVRGETIAALGRGSPPPADRIVDFSGKLILPGLVDGHIHTSSVLGWAGIEGATRSAAAGGITTCVDMPYDPPNPITNASLLKEKIAWVNRTAHVDMALYGTILKAEGTARIAELVSAGISAFKFSTYEYDPVRFPRIDHPLMAAALAEIAKTGVPVSVHNEDQELVTRLTDNARANGASQAIMHCRTRPPLAETLADLEIFEIGRETGAHVHLAHSSLARGFELASYYRADGCQASAETCIHYLCMTEDDMERLKGRAKCNPPLRPREDVEALWKVLLEDQVGFISSDHAPWSTDRKDQSDIFSVSAGLVGLQSFAPLMYTLLSERDLSPTIMAKYCSEQPALYHGLYPKKGAIRLGSDCDLVILEPGESVFDETRIVDRPELRWSPYHGRKMAASVAATVLRGRVIWNGEQVCSEPGTGRFVPRISQ